jgi:hypothetical protein
MNERRTPLWDVPPLAKVPGVYADMWPSNLDLEDLRYAVYLCWRPAPEDLLE